jgi:hypothetical protein
MDQAMSHRTSAMSVGATQPIGRNELAPSGAA